MRSYHTLTQEIRTIKTFSEYKKRYTANKSIIKQEVVSNIVITETK